MSPKSTQFEHLLEAVPEALVGVDQKGAIRFVNHQVELLFGYDRDQLIGEPIDKLVPETLWEAYAQHRRDYFADPWTRSSGLQVELDGRHRDGSEFPINISLSHIDIGDVLLVITAVGDVSMHRQAVKNAQLLEAIVEYSDDAIASMTADGIMTTWNPAAEVMYGYASGEVIGKPGSSILPEDRVGEWNAVLASIRDGRVVEHADLVLPHKDGTPVPVSVTVAPLRNGDGDVVGAVSVHRDVSEQRRAFEAAQRMTAIVEGSDDAIIGETLDGVITSWNPAATTMFGYSGEEIIGRSVGLLVPEDQAEQAKAVAAKVSAGQHVERFETFNVRKDGTVFSILLTVSPIRDADGVVVGASVICRDTTEQVQAAKVLAETSRRYRLLAENASDVVALTSPDRAFVWVSPSVTRTLGWAPDDLLGTQLGDLMHPDDAVATGDARDGLYSGHAKPGGFLARMRTKSGDYRWMAVTATPVTDESGAFAGVVGGGRDVDELVRTREAAKTGEAALRATMDSLMDPHVLLEAVRDKNGQIVDFVYVDANPAACAYDGIAYQDLVGARLLDHCPGEVGAYLLDLYRQVVDTGEPLMLDDVVFAQEPSGEERRLDISAARVGDGLSYTWRDVTDRHAAARWLAESEEHYRLLADNASDVIIRLGPDRRFEWVSGSVADVLGWTAPDLLGHVIDEFIDPEELAPFRHAIADTSPEVTSSAEFRFRHSDGTSRWVLCHTRMKVNEDGTPAALVGGLIDIEARKAVEAQELDRLADLERFQRLTVGRELKMIELKKEIETLRSLLRRAGGGDKH